MFLDKQVCGSPTRPKMCKYFFLQILNPMNNAEIWAPELVSDQNEMVGLQVVHTFFMLKR